MAGLDPAIHVFRSEQAARGFSRFRAWMAGPLPAVTCLVVR
jgi:hypothetical protein